VYITRAPFPSNMALEVLSNRDGFPASCLIHSSKSELSHSVLSTGSNPLAYFTHFVNSARFVKNILTGTPNSFAICAKIG